MQLFISNIPEESSNRAVRKCIGSALRKQTGKLIMFKLKVNRRRPGAGPARAVLILEQKAGDQIVDLLINRRCPLICQGVPLRVDIDRRVNNLEHEWDQKHLSATRPGDVASDYASSEEEDDETPLRFVRKKLHVKQVSLGAWDGDGKFVDAFRSRCNGPWQSVTIDQDAGRMSIVCHLGTIRINLYDIKYSINDPEKGEYYLTLRNLPTYLTSTDDPSTQVRVSHFRVVEHEMAAKYSYVIRLQYLSPLHHFLRYHNKRLSKPDVLQVEKSTITVLMTRTLQEELDSFYRELPFDTAFQANALITSWQILPMELYALRPSFLALDEKTGASRVRNLAADIDWRDPRPRASRNVTMLDISRMLGSNHAVPVPTSTTNSREELSSEERARSAFYQRRTKVHAQDAVLIHSVVITPAGIQLIGPSPDPGNRILRKYPGLDNQYLRVSFKEETGELLREERGINNDTEILSGRFRSFMLGHIVLAGVKFEFLAFSNSQLKSHSCWFVRSPLLVDGTRMVTAQNIRDSIGDLKSIRCPPKFAARLGQAFTTTFYSIPVSKDQVVTVKDIKSRCGKYEFSDGVGSISADMVALLNTARKTEMKISKVKNSRSPCVFQVRLGGAKGVLALDTRLQGETIHLRPSMIKFASTENKVELAVAKAFTEPGQCYLNRPLIALLETIGVPYHSFKRMQDESLERIEAATRTPSGAGKLIRDLALGSAARVPSALSALQRDFGYNMDDIMSVPFLRDVIRTAVFHSLRTIKYKAHIKVNNAYLLMGIMDESGLLEEGEIYVCLGEGNGRKYLRGQALVYRSPTLHPGDVQFVNAIGEVPKTSMLYSLTNCLVFSQKGKRPLPSMLAGGDLDGDEYSVVQDPRLFPPDPYPSAEYHSDLGPPNIGRDVTKTDIVDFFLNHLVTNKVGMLANRHLILSDQSEEGVVDEDCIDLAKLYSEALDYPKTGRLPDLSRLPRAHGRPDYLEPEFQVEERHNKDKGKLKLLGRTGSDFYNSKKALGRLFRSIEVPHLLKGWGLAEEKGGDAANSITAWQDDLLRYLRPVDSTWVHYTTFHRGLIDFYYKEIHLLANGFHTGGREESLSGAEIFLGCITMRTPYQSRKQLFETNESLRNDYRDLVSSFLDVACSPPNVDAVDMSELAGNLRQQILMGTFNIDEETGEDEVSDDGDESSTGITTVRAEIDRSGIRVTTQGDIVMSDGRFDRSRALECDQNDEVRTQSSWQSIDASSGEWNDGTRTATSNVDDAFKANRIYLALYSLFVAACEAQRKDETKQSCPWVIFPRLVAAKKKAEKTAVLLEDY